MSSIILVTGANRGIGFAIVQSTALRAPNSIYILSCRSQGAGEDAIVELKKLGITASLDVVVIDVTDDASIIEAKDAIEKKYGKLDMLVNNAGIAILQKTTELADLRDSFNTTFNENVTSIAAVTSIFLPLLRLSSDPRVIHVSSGRASIQRSTGDNFPPTAAVAYSISKVALNALTIEQQKVENGRTGNERDGSRVDFYTITPGHCKTAFNGYRGTKDPLDGAEVVVRLAMARRGEWKAGSFLEFEDGAMREVPW